MNPNTTFRKWLDASKNNGQDKRWNLLYIQKLNENIGVLPNVINALEWKQFLKWVDTPYGKIELEEAQIIGSLRNLCGVLDLLISDQDRYFELFGDSIAGRYKTMAQDSIGHSIGDCKTALDQYARFLHGSDSKCAQHASYVRYFYEPQIIAAKEQGKDKLVLEYKPEEMLTLSKNLDTVKKALGIQRMWQQYGINSVNIRDGKLEVKFAKSSDRNTTNKSHPGLNFN